MLPAAFISPIAGFPRVASKRYPSENGPRRRGIGLGFVTKSEQAEISTGVEGINWDTGFGKLV